MFTHGKVYFEHAELDIVIVYNVGDFEIKYRFMILKYEHNSGRKRKNNENSLKISFVMFEFLFL